MQRKACLSSGTGRQTKIKGGKTMKKVIGILMAILTLALAGGAFQSWL